MKTKIVLLAILTTTLLAVFTSCKKDETPIRDSRLVNTIWATNDLAYQLLNGGDCKQCYKFTSDKDGEFYRTRNGEKVTFFSDITYQLDYPNLIIVRLKDNATFKYTLKNSSIFEANGVEVNNNNYTRYTKQ